VKDELDRQEIVKVLESFYAAFANEDYGPYVQAYLSKDVIWHIAGDNPLAGDVVGAAAVVERMRDYGRRSKQTLNLKTSITATATHGIAVHEATAQNDGFEYVAHEIDVFHIANGLITEFWSFSEDQKATDRMWS
jgi:ketosteroid isomerase-like protein